MRKKCGKMGATPGKPSFPFLLVLIALFFSIEILEVYLNSNIALKSITQGWR